MKVRSIFLGLCVFSISAMICRAQSIWDGLGGNTNWSTSLNWVVAPPNNGTDILIFSGLSPFTSTVNTNWSLSSLSVASTAGALTLDSTGGATLNIGSGFYYGGFASVAVNVPIAGVGEFWLNGGTGTVTLNPGTGSNTYSGTTEVFGGATLADGEANSYSAGSVLYPGGTGGGTVKVNFNETIAGLQDGGANGQVDLATGATLTLTGVYSTTFSGVIFSTGALTMNGPGTLTLEGANTYSGATTINAGGAINLGGGTGSGSITSNVSGAGALSFDRNNAYTYAGTLSGALNVVQQGTGTTTLTGTNSYSGPTTVNFGVLRAGSTSAFGGSGDSAVTINAGGTLALNNNSNTVGSIAGSGAITLGTATLTLATPAASSPFAGVISGTGGLNLTGVNAITTLSGANLYSGGTTVATGFLVADNSSGSATGSGMVTVDPSAVLQIGDADTAGSVGAAAITDNGTIQFARTDPTVFASAISGSGGISELAGGIVTISGNNTYSGATFIAGGGLTAASGTAFGDGLSPLNIIAGGTLNLGAFAETFGSISGDSTAIINTGTGTLTTGALNASTTFAGVIQGSGSLIVVGTGATTLSGTNSYTGNTVISDGTLADGAAFSFSSASQVEVDAGAQLVANFDETIGNLNSSGAGGTVTIASGHVLDSLGENYIADFNGVISGGGTFEVGAGVQGLSGNNTYTGGTLVSGNGEIFVGSNSALGTGILTFNGVDTELSPDANVTLANPIVLDSLLDNDDGGNNNLTLTGQISGPAGITWCAPGTLTLTNNNTFTGPVDMRQGTLVVESNTAAGAVTNIVTLAGSTNSGLNVQNGVTFSNPLSIGGTGNVLSGNGTIASPSVTVDSTVVLSPSASPGGGPGNLSFTNPLTLASGGTMNFGLYDATGAAGTGFGLVTANGGLNLTASADSFTFNLVSIDGSGNPAAAINFNAGDAYSWKFISSPTFAITGFSSSQFNIVTSGFLNGTTGGVFSITGTTNNLFLNFTPVPEPSTWVLLGMGVLAVVPLAVRRRVAPN